MSKKKNRYTIVSIPVFSLLGFVFVLMKLLDIGQVASWPWWQVLSPFWGPPLLLLTLFAAIPVTVGLFGAVVLAVLAIAGLIAERIKNY